MQLNSNRYGQSKRSTQDGDGYSAYDNQYVTIIIYNHYAIIMYNHYIQSLYIPGLPL